MDAAGSKNQIDLCVLYTGSVTGCNADTNNISANREPNPVNSIVSTTTEDDPVTLVAVTVTEDGFINLQLMLIPTLVNDSVLT